MALFAKLFNQSRGPSDDYWYQRPFGLLPETKAGARIDQITALGVPAVWICVRILAEDLASLPLHLYQSLEKGSRKALNHPLYPLLHDRPNPEMSAMGFRETQMGHILTWGNAYAEKDLDVMGRVKALWPIAPHRVQVFRSNDSGELFYRVTLETGGGTIELRREQILHVPGFGYNGLIGYSPISLMRESIGLAAATEEFGARFFGHGMHPGVVVSHPMKLSDQGHKNLNDSLTTAYSGLGNSHRLLLLEEAMKIEKIGIPPNDAQFLETRAFQVAEIGSRIFRIPLHMLGVQDKAASYASVEQFALQYVKHTLRPWAVRFEQAYSGQLLATDLERRRYYWEHRFEGLLRADYKTRMEGYQLAVQNGVMCPDEVRELENLNPREDGLGGVYLRPANIVPADTPGTQPAPAQPATEPAKPDPPQPAPPGKPPAAEDDRAWWNSRLAEGQLAASFKPLFVDALEQVLSREAIQLGRLLKGADNPAAVIETFYTDGSDIQVFIARKVEPVITALLGNLGVEAGKVASEVAIFTENHIETSEDILQAGRNLALLETFEGQAEARASGYLTAILGRLRGNDDV